MNTDDIRKAFRRLPENSSRLISAVVMGTVSGLSAVAFMLCVQFVFENGLVRLSNMPLSVFIPASLAVVLASSLAVGLLLGKLSPRSSGSGIPQLKTAFWKDLGFVEFRHAAVKFVAGALSIGGGTSLGREGPSVFIGGTVASGAAGLLGAPRQGRRRALLMGAAAALAAAFNTPLAAITFVLTLINGNRHYWGHIIAMPGVPKPVLLILTPVEILGVFLRPAILMIRLFANITAGHIIVLSFFALIFIFGEINAGLGYGVSIFTLVFTIFMSMLELLVAFIQAFVFTFLSAMYLGAAIEEPHHH